MRWKKWVQIAGMVGWMLCFSACESKQEPNDILESAVIETMSSSVDETTADPW